MNRRLERVHIASLRVALMAAAVFAVLYAIIATLIVVVVTSNLTSQIDNRLNSDLAAVQAGRQIPAPGSNANIREPGGARFGAPQLFAWVVLPDGTQETNAGVTLPAGAGNVSAPTTVTLNGYEVRITGTTIQGEHVVLGQQMDSVSQTRSTIALTEFIVGLVLLVVAFVGALMGGRRVGSPIELARQRQMEFTADASHELRTPLSVIEAQTSLALSQEREAEWYRNAFRRIATESGRIRRLVEDLLWLARLDVEPARGHTEPVEAGVLAEQTVERFTAVAESHRQSLRLTVSDEPHMVSGSPEWLDRLLGVLIDNACKYAPEGGTVQVSVLNDGNRVVVRVDDSGPGIADEERGRIFERFHRATTAHRGAGLGLAIADAVVRRTQGRWEVGASAQLGGASLAVSWPRSGTREPAPVAQIRPEPAAPEPIPMPPPAAPPSPAPPAL
ncbi:MAG: sensor histidine kinase [Candidatus Dormibacteria bacterium]